jgi:hypothetical protein
LVTITPSSIHLELVLITAEADPEARFLDDTAVLRQAAKYARARDVLTRNVDAAVHKSGGKREDHTLIHESPGKSAAHHLQMAQSAYERARLGLFHALAAA